MRTLAILILGLLAITFASPTLALADGYKFVRIDVDNITAEQSLSGTIVSTFGNETRDANIALKAGDLLQSSFVFPWTGPGNWSVELTVEGRTLLSAEGLLISDSEVIQYEVQAATIDKASLELEPDKEAICLVVGSASGSLETEVSFLKNTEAVASIGLDLNNDGNITGEETTRQPISGMDGKGSTPTIASIPLTARYEVVVQGDEAVLASNSGSYDFAKGQTVQCTRFIDTSKVAALSVTHARVPSVAFVRLPNTMFELPRGTENTVTQSLQTTIDTLEAGNGTSSNTAGSQDTKNSGSGEDAWTHISTFLGKYWPWLAVLGAVIVGGLFLTRFVFRSR